MNRFLQIFTLLASLGASAQPNLILHTPRTDHLFPEEADASYILTDQATLHVSPDIEADVLVRLPAGTSLWLEEVAPDTTWGDGLRSPWYRSKVGIHEGWVWGGHIARYAFGSASDPTVKFVAGLERVHLMDTTMMPCIYRIVALRKGKSIATYSIRSFGCGVENINSLGGRGLSNVDDIITIGVPCVGGCGCTMGEVVVFWSGGVFHHVGDLMGSPDGNYSENTRFIYPTDMEGMPGTIIQETSTYDDEATLEPAEGESATLTRIVRREFRVWNGATLVPSDRPTEERRYQLVLPKE